LGQRAALLQAVLREDLGLRLWRRGDVAGAIAAFSHELIEFGAVLGEAKPL
jgi:hypothetical protein